MRSRSGRDNRFSDLTAAGRISTRHDCSVSEFRLRLVPRDRRLGPSCFDRCAIVVRQGLIIELDRFKPRDHRILSPPEKDRRCVKRFLRKSVNELVKFSLVTINKLPTALSEIDHSTSVKVA